MPTSYFSFQRQSPRWVITRSSPFVLFAVIIAKFSSQSSSMPLELGCLTKMANHEHQVKVNRKRENKIISTSITQKSCYCTKQDKSVLAMRQAMKQKGYGKKFYSFELGVATIFFRIYTAKEAPAAVDFFFKKRAVPKRTVQALGDNSQRPHFYTIKIGRTMIILSPYDHLPTPPSALDKIRTPPLSPIDGASGPHLNKSVTQCHKYSCSRSIIPQPHLVFCHPRQVHLSPISTLIYSL
jgi:hypothetical protein